MHRASFKDPLLLSFVGLGIVLLPVIVLLAEMYPSYEERMRRAAGPPRFVEMPSEERLLELVHQREPATLGLRLQSVYIAEDEPHTGIVRVYDLVEEDRVSYMLILFRHDIACDICRDILAGALYRTSSATWAQILLIEPFEKKGALADVTPFLAQFLGKSVQTRFQLGKNVDGITGATKSVKAFINRLHEAAGWLETHRTAETVSLIGEEARL